MCVCVCMRACMYYTCVGFGEGGIKTQRRQVTAPTVGYCFLYNINLRKVSCCCYAWVSATSHCTLPPPPPLHISPYRYLRSPTPPPPPPQLILIIMPCTDAAETQTPFRESREKILKFGLETKLGPNISFHI